MVGRHAAAPSRTWRWVPIVLGLVIVAATAAVLWSQSGHGGAGSLTTSSTAPTTTTSLAPVTTTTVPTSFTLSAVGDTDLGDTPSLPSDPLAYFAPMKSALAANVVFGNLEGTMTNGGDSKCGASSTECYAFRVPPSYATVYRQTGFTVLNSANNHSYDFGAQGQADTSAALKAAGIVQAGLPGQIGLVTVKGIRVAFVDFAPYTLTNDMLNLAQAAQLISQAKHEAQVVVVYMHSGAEGEDADHVTRQSEFYYGENRGNPYAFAHFAIDQGADLVLGSGPHVLRGMEWYRGRLIAYSLGDFTNYEAFASVGDLTLSAVLHVTMTQHGTITAASVVPVAIQGDGQALVDPTDATWSFMNQLSREDFGASAALIGSHGSLAVPAGA